MPPEQVLQPAVVKIKMIEYEVRILYADKEKEKTSNLGCPVRVWADKAQVVRGDDALGAELTLAKVEAVSRLFQEVSTLIKAFPKEQI